LKQRASVTIIGGGIIGASVAYNLAVSGVRDIVVLEMSVAGGGSTVSSLGGFRAQFSNELSVRLSQRSIRIIERFQELTGYDPLVRHDGYVFIASTEKSHERLRRDSQLQKGLGVPVEMVGREELQSRFPFYMFDDIIGGTVCMEDGHASTMAVLQGYLSSSKKMGVEVNENTEVRGIERSSEGGFVLKTRGGRLVTESLVIAAGAYSGVVGGMASVKIPIEPLPRKVLITNSFSDGIPDSIPLIVDVDSTFAFGREGKGLLFGTNPAIPRGFELVFRPDYEDEVLAAALERVPATRGCSPSRSVAGLYEMSPDANPIVGSVPGEEGMYCCAGFAGHGFMHAPAIGEIFAELFTKGRTSVDISAFDMGRFAKGAAETEGRIV
jgi:sarcosine oxidase, subunit beta